MKQDWDVIVVGAGPAGSAAAYELARSGWSILLLEKEPVPGQRKACGGLALTDLKYALSLPATICEKELNRVVFAFGGREKRWLSPRPFFLSFRRREFDAFLAQRAVLAGARLLCNSRVIRSGFGEVTVRHQGDGGESVLGAKIVIYADGIPTRARQDRGIGFSPGDPSTQALVYELAAPGHGEEAVRYQVEPDDFPSGCFWIIPKRDLFNVGAARWRGIEGVSLKIALDRFCREHPLTAGRQIVSRRAGIIPNRRAHRMHGDNCLVAGDAAGLADPVTGAGIHYAIVSGSLAARAASRALEIKSYDAATLSLYPRLWRGSPEGRWISFWGLVFRTLPFLNARVNPECLTRALRLNTLLGLRLHRLKRSRLNNGSFPGRAITAPGPRPRRFGDLADLLPGHPGRNPGQEKHREQEIRRPGTGQQQREVEGDDKMGEDGVEKIGRGSPSPEVVRVVESPRPDEQEQVNRG